MYDQITNPAHQWRVATDKFIANPENLSAWIESSNKERTASAYFGFISDYELWEILLCETKDGNQIHPEQRIAARKTIWHRIQTQHPEEIAALEEKETQ